MREESGTRIQFVHDLSQRFVVEHCRDEAEFFSVVWECFERTGNESQVKRSQLMDELVGGLPFAASGGTTIVSPYVVLTLDAVFRELNVQDSAPALSAVESAIRHTAKAFGAPAHLTKRLVENLGPQLHATLETLSIDSLPDTGQRRTPESDVWVEYCIEEPSVTSRATVIEDWQNVNCVFESEVLSCEAFMLFVDETNHRIECRSWNQRQMRPNVKAVAKVAWELTPNQQRRLLHAILNSMRSRRSIGYNEFVPDHPDHGSPSTVKSNLFASCGGILDEIVRAVTNASRLEIIGRIPYCWIRRSSDSSDLCPSESS